MYSRAQSNSMFPLKTLELNATWATIESLTVLFSHITLIDDESSPLTD
jgi:hypothetical protein